MNKNNTPIYFAIATVFGILIGTFFNGKSSTVIGVTPSNEQKIKRLINYIENEYVDEVNTNDLLDGAITEMLEKLDPHSVYIPKEELQAVTENMQGNFVGIGVQFRIENDTIAVIQPIEDGPSIKAGIKAGDRILMADGDTIFGKSITNSQVFKQLKGKPNTKVNLQIYRKTNDSIFTISVIRGRVNIKSVDVAYMLNDSIGFIKLNRFAQNTYQEFKSSLDTLLSKGMTDLVLDLRGNGGGFIHIAHKIADEFLEDDKLVVYTKNNKGEIDELYATQKGDFEQGGLYVLIDENSASASEILAGALQDNDKGIIIGRRSFGKGLVQEEMELGDGSAVRLTTARYYTPTGRSIQKPYKSKKASKPPRQFNAENNETGYENEVNERYDNGELFSKDSIKVVDSLQFKTPKGKIVYGGGGIVPDVFVSIDTTQYLPTLFFKSLNDFSFTYVDKNRKRLSKISLRNFIENFDIKKTSEQYFATQKSIRLSERNKQSIRKYLKTIIARELYGDEGLYKLNLKDDKMIEKVFELEEKSLN